MSSIGTSMTRTTALLASSQLMSSLRRTQSELLKMQTAISTGKMVNRPSEAPQRASAILMLRQQIQARKQWDQNLQHASGLLNVTDAVLADASNLLLESKAIALAEASSTSNRDTRANQAVVIDAQLQALIGFANQQFSGISIFGGNQGAPVGENVFVEFLGGVRYLGATQNNLAGEFDMNTPVDFNSNGAAAFGALSSRVRGLVDLDPRASADVRLTDVRGAQNTAIRLGSVQLTVNGSAMTLDLSGAHTLGDVVIRMNAAIESIDPTAGALSIGDNGFELTANAGHTISISDLPNGLTAADLGIAFTATSGTAVGEDINPRLTLQTRLADFPGGLDLTSGLLITQGQHTKVADFSGATTVQDMVNVIEKLGLGLRLEINQAGTGLDLVSEVSGLELSIGENGGSTAEDLGLRSFGRNTALRDLRFGLGVTTQPDEPDFAFELHDGRTFEVNIDGAQTVGDVLAAIQAAATAAGIVVGEPGDGASDFNLGLATTGNGFTFEDNTAGGGNFRVRQLGTSLAATHLGIYTNAETGNTIVGEDVAKVRAESVFTHLINLRNALQNDDTLGITLAGEGIERDIESIARARADVGVRAQRIERQMERSAEMNITEEALLENLQGADLTEVITRFTQLQQQMEASLRASAATHQTSLLDFLR